MIDGDEANLNAHRRRPICYCYGCGKKSPFKRRL